MPRKKKLKFGRYEVESELGQGAMGTVYKAFDPLTQRPVAIKALKREIDPLTQRPVAIKALKREILAQDEASIRKGSSARRARRGACRTPTSLPSSMSAITTSSWSTSKAPTC